MLLRQLLLISVTGVILCTPALLSAADNKAAAQRLIEALGCKGCHKLAGDGATLAPALDEIGSRMTREQISTHLVKHTEDQLNGFMPKYNTTPKKELDLLSDYLYNLQ